MATKLLSDTSVLLVEDNDDIRELAVQVLRSAGAGVDAVGDARSAMARIQEKKYDAAVLDLVLPDIDGLSILRELREGGYLGGAVVFTANAMKETQGAVEATGAIFLPKPASGPALVDAVAAAAGAKPSRMGSSTVGGSFLWPLL